MTTANRTDVRLAELEARVAEIDALSVEVFGQYKRLTSAAADVLERVLERDGDNLGDLSRRKLRSMADECRAAERRVA